MNVHAEQAQHAKPTATIFISYSRKDMAFADRLEAALKARGFEPLIDRAEIYAFEDWWKRIQALIGGADTIVFALSPDAVKSEVALKEITYAASLNKRFAPIVCQRVDDSAIPEPLRRLNFIFFDDPTRFEANADALAKALRTDVEWIRRHTELGEAARRWQGSGRPGGMLLLSPLLEEAEFWAAYRPHGAPPPTAETQSYIAASRQADTASKRRARLTQTFIYVLLLGIIGGLIVWINQAFIKEQWTYYTSVRPFLAANVWPYVLGESAEHALWPKDSFRECAPLVVANSATGSGRDYCPDMVVVAAGRFIMGSPSNEPGFTDEVPQQNVTIDQPFAVSKYEVTFAEWDTCVAYGGCEPNISDAGFGRGERPVIQVSWDNAQQYVAWLSKVTGKPYGLLSNAEYEYAARAGTQTPFPWGRDIGKKNANCNACGSQWDNQETAPVGSFAPNQFGLYDMAGNVWEWVEDCFHPNYTGTPTDGSAWASPDCDMRVMRGGSWASAPAELRSASRSGIAPDRVTPLLGFRVARTIGH
jgi:formylglycine-generating enzyme required for sulfatase activity